MFQPNHSGLPQQQNTEEGHCDLVKTNRSSCCQMAVQRALWLAKHFSLNLNFSFLNWILLLLISSSYPIVLTRLGGPRSRSYTSRKISRVQPGIEPGTSWMAVRRASHYTKQTLVANFIPKIFIIYVFTMRNCFTKSVSFLALLQS